MTHVQETAARKWSRFLQHVSYGYYFFPSFSFSLVRLSLRVWRALFEFNENNSMQLSDQRALSSCNIIILCKTQFDFKLQNIVALCVNVKVIDYKWKVMCKWRKEGLLCTPGKFSGVLVPPNAYLSPRKWFGGFSRNFVENTHRFSSHFPWNLA